MRFLKGLETSDYIGEETIIEIRIILPLSPCRDACSLSEVGWKERGGEYNVPLSGFTQGYF